MSTVSIYVQRRRGGWRKENSVDDLIPKRDRARERLLRSPLLVSSLLYIARVSHRRRPLSETMKSTISRFCLCSMALLALLLREGCCSAQQYLVRSMGR